jgi:hypothetical protein
MTVNVERIDEESDFRWHFRTTRPNDTQGWNGTKVLVQMVDLEVETAFSSSSMTTALGRRSATVNV